MKKAISFLVITVMMVGITSVSAYVRCGNCNTIINSSANSNSDNSWSAYDNTYVNKSQSRQSVYEICTEADCDILGQHLHGDVWYCSQTGCCIDYDICAVVGCALIGIHEHDGEYYRCSNAYYTTSHGCGRNRIIN